MATALQPRQTQTKKGSNKKIVRKSKRKSLPRLDDEKVQSLRRRLRLIGSTQLCERRIHFALKYHRSTKGKPLDFTYRQYLLQPYSDPCPDVTLQVPVQIGKTEWQVCDSLAAASLGLAAFVVQPKFELRGVHVAERYNKLIQASPEYQKFVIHSKSDSTTLKHFGRGTLRFVGSRVDTDMISFPADVLEIDEIDRCDLKILSLAEDRLEESDYKIVRRTSTPTTPGSNENRNINYYFQLGNQQRWYIPCPECGFYQELRWDTHLVEVRCDEEGKIIDMVLQDGDWTEGKWQRTGQFIKLPCVECRSPLNRLSPGVWRAKNPHARDRSSYTMSRLIAVTSEVEKMWLSLQDAVGNPSAMMRVVNSLFGEPYRGIGDRFTDDMLNQAVSVAPEYIAPCTPVGPCSMGVDVNMPFFDVWISDYPNVDTEKTVRRCVFAGKVRKESDLHALIDEYGVQTVVIDAEPEARLALNFQAQARCEVWRCRYEHSEGLMVNDMRLNQKEGLVCVDRTSTLDSLLQRFLQHCVALPKNHRSLCEGKMAKDFTRAVRILTDAQGVERYIWLSQNCHSLHTCNYDLLAQRLGGFVPVGSSPFILKGSDVGMQPTPTQDLINAYAKLTGVPNSFREPV